MQYDSPWPEQTYQYYANVEGKTIGVHGCLLTTLSMMLNYYGLVFIPDTSNFNLPTIDPICGSSEQTKPFYCKDAEPYTL
jgi:hypothetical protein